MAGVGVVARLTIALGVVMGAGVVTAITGPVQANAPVTTSPEVPEFNPMIADSCGIDVVLVLDASGSISSSNAVDDVRNAGEAFLDALADTGSFARVLQFGSLSEELAPRTEVTAASLQDGQVFGDAIKGYYNPKPPILSGVSLHEYRSGDPKQSGSWRSSTANQYTNWDQSLDQANDPDPRTGRPAELIVYVTDGDPTAYDFNQAGDPFDAGPPPDVGVKTDANSTVRQLTIDRAVAEANEAKNAQTRILAVGVGSAVTGSSASRTRLTQIAGPLAVSDGSVPGIPNIDTVDSINEVDVALVRDFDKLASFLRGVVSELCSPSLSIRKLAQSADSADYLPAPDWEVTVDPTVTNPTPPPPGSYRWILPDTDATQRQSCFAGSPPGSPPLPTGLENDQASRTCLTDATGLANFQWEPSPEDSPTSALVTETLRDGWTAGRPGADNDWRCTLKNDDGTEETLSGDFLQGSPTFQLDVDPQQIITCNIYNSFDYRGRAISLSKVDTPGQVRGNPSGPDSTVTSTFTVTNPGTSALTNVRLIDDTCTPVYQSGDIGNDGILDNDPAETWIYTCTRVLSSSPGQNPEIVTNNARVDAVDPAGTAVSDTATANVAVYAPAITLTKSPSRTTVPLNQATDVIYSYVATNTGNMTLTTVTVKDDLGPSTCRGVTPVAPATSPITLAPGASQAFSCTASLTATDLTPFENIADVVGTPAFPTPPPDVDPSNGPVGLPVTAQAPAVVTVVDQQLVLTKAVDKPVIFPNTRVTYTYTVNNPGNVALRRPVGDPVGSPDPRDGWIVDTGGPTGTCAPVTYVSGDSTTTGTLEVLDPGETWTYTCATVLGAVPTRVVNTAVVVAEPVGGGPRLTRTAQAVVEVVTPAITIDKAAVRPAVLDVYDGLPLGNPPGPIAGPDVPGTTPAAYVFTVRNTGNVPIRDVVVTDDFPNNSTTSCPPDPVTVDVTLPFVGTFNIGDANRDGFLDPGEAWEYDCTVRLTKATDADNAPAARNVVGVATNTASVTGEAFFGQELPFPVAATSEEVQVLIISPEASITKIPCTGDPVGALTCSDDLVVRPGTDVTYKYEFRNVGDTTLRPLGLIDDRCDGITYFDGDTNRDGLVGGGTTSPEVWEYRCTATINGPDTVVNTVDVFAVGPLGNLYVDEATASVRVFDPAISLVKTARESLVPSGTPVTYDFEVTNVGESSLPADDVLEQIRLVDASLPAQPSCSIPTPVLPQGDGDDVMARGETWFYECTATLTADTTNLALVTGVGGVQLGLPTPVADLDVAFVAVFNPAIDVVKTANPTSVLESGDVTYTYEVRNTGDVPLAGVKTSITDDKCAPVSYVSGDEDGDELLDTPNSIFEDAADEVWIFTCTATITTDTVNVVTVTGTPTDPGGEPLCSVPVDRTAARTANCDVTDTATANVTVLRRGSITIVKNAEPNGATAFSFTGTLGSFQLVDNGSTSNTTTFSALAPGSYSVAEVATPGWVLSAIVCTDPTTDTNVDLAGGSAVIALGSGENITCTFTNTQLPPIVQPPPVQPPLPPPVVQPPAPSPTLPQTGLAIGGPALGAGLALLLVGLGLVRIGRRRRYA